MLRRVSNDWKSGRPAEGGPLRDAPKRFVSFVSEPRGIAEKEKLKRGGTAFPEVCAKRFCGGTARPPRAGPNSEILKLATAKVEALRIFGGEGGGDPDLCGHVVRGGLHPYPMPKGAAALGVTTSLRDKTFWGGRISGKGGTCFLLRSSGVA